MNQPVIFYSRAPGRTTARRGVAGAATCLSVLVTLLSASAQEPNDAISREFSVYNDLAPPIVITDAVSREFSVQNNLEPPIVLTDTVSREFSVYDDLEPPVVLTDAISREFVVLKYEQLATSSSAALAYPIAGSLPDQLMRLNSGPPPFDPNDWLPVHRRNANAAQLFRCDQVPNPIALGYVYAETYLPYEDEVTFDNCGSAFYRFTFTLPDNVRDAKLLGVANADPEGIVFVNGYEASGRLTVPSCQPGGDPNDPCFGQQDAWHDRSDAQGVPILTVPTVDAFRTLEASQMQPGENELVFGICADAAYYRPTGIEFRAFVLYQLRGDLNCDGVVNFGDINAFVLALSDPNAYQRAYPNCPLLNGDINADDHVDFGDINPFVALLSGGGF